MEDNFDLTPLRKKPKTRINSKAKGSNFERQIVKKLNERFNTKDFCRTPGSGAFSTTHTLPSHLQIHGDLITPVWFRFCLELKAGYNKESLSSIFNKKSEFWGFWEQASRDALKANKPPIVIFKQNNKDIICVIQEEVMKDYKSSFEYLYLNFNDYKLIIVKFSDFLSLSEDFFKS